MKNKTIFNALPGWIKQIKLPERPEKKIIGKWQLVEYYIDREKELLHFDEASLKTNNINFILTFLESSEFILRGNLPVVMFSSFQEGNWSISRNYLNWIHPKNANNNIRFQFAFDKGIFKILKKDEKGNIEFFGLFRKKE